MKDRVSRFPGFYRATIAERRRLLAEASGVALDELVEALDRGGISSETADKFVENVLGTYALPFGVALNVRVNGRDFVVPMVVEEPSVVAAASNAAKMVRAGSGFSAEVDPPIMTSQVEIHDVRDAAAGSERVIAARDELLRIANESVPGLVERGGGARDLEVRALAEDVLVAHLYVDCRDAMGANLVNTIAEAVGARVAELAGGTLGLRILSNLCDRRRVRVVCRVPVDALATDDLAGADVAKGIAQASRFAELDPYRAATHNKGIMNGVDAVCIATGNDWRAVEAGAHAFAARDGRYGPLAVWRVRTHAGESVLEGSLELPLALGTVGGTLRVHPAARIALRIVGTESASELAAVAAAVGLASNLAALRALATEGIQRGHMSLHARAVAIAAGAKGDAVERVAAMIVEAREITVEGAQRALATIGAGG
jgi:hydroxymethylglutaryl-CoA reductase